MGMAVMAVVVMVRMMVACMETSSEREPDELGFALEPEGSVDDELSDIVKTPVHRQYAARVWVLRDRSGEDARREFGWEVGEGRHGGFRVSPSGESASSILLSPAESQYRCLNLAP
jgi:hypothetical protein